MTYSWEVPAVTDFNVSRDAKSGDRGNQLYQDLITLAINATLARAGVVEPGQIG